MGPLNSGHVGTRHFIHYGEVILCSEAKKIIPTRKRYPLFGSAEVSFI